RRTRRRECRLRLREPCRPRAMRAWCTLSMVAAACVFCSIKEEKVPASIVWRDDAALVFLDAKPLFKGHALVVPAAHVTTLDDLPPAEVGPFFATVQRIARAVQRGLGADGSFVAMNNVVSQSVPHLHVHVVPRVKGDGLRGFFWPRQKYANADESADYARRIREALDSAGADLPV